MEFTDNTKRFKMDNSSSSGGSSTTLRDNKIIRVGTWNGEVGLNWYDYVDINKGDTTFPWGRPCESATINPVKKALVDKTFQASGCCIVGVQEWAIDSRGQALLDELISGYTFGSLHLGHSSSWARAVKKGGEGCSLGNGILVKDVMGFRTSNPEKIDVSSPCVGHYTRSASMCTVHISEEYCFKVASYHGSGGFQDDPKVVTKNADPAFRVEKKHQLGKIIEKRPDIIMMDGNAKLWNPDPIAVAAFEAYKKQIIDGLKKNNNLCEDLTDEQINYTLNKFLCQDHPNVSDSNHALLTVAGYRLGNPIESIQHTTKFGGSCDLIYFLDEKFELTEEPAHIINKNIVMIGEDPYKQTPYLSDHHFVAVSLRIKQ